MISSRQDCDSNGMFNMGASITTPTKMPSEVTMAPDDIISNPGESKPIENTQQYLINPSKDIFALSQPEKEFNLSNDVSDEIKLTNPHSTDEDSSYSFDRVSTNGLKWTAKKTSRVGQDYQVSQLPEAGSYLNLQGDDFYQLEQLLLADQIWDPLKATLKDINNFVHDHCPSNKKEAALEVIHQNDYDVSSFANVVDRLEVLDGSDWSLSDHDHFRRLMQSTRHDVLAVAKTMGKSISNCLTVYYSIINVRVTRSAKKKFTGIKPMDEVNMLKDIGRSLRIDKRNERKKSSCENESEATSTNRQKKRRRKATSASDKLKDPSSKLRSKAPERNDNSQINDIEIGITETRSLSPKAGNDNQTGTDTSSANADDDFRLRRSNRAAKQQALVLIAMGNFSNTNPSVSRTSKPKRDFETRRITRRMASNQNMLYQNKEKKVHKSKTASEILDSTDDESQDEGSAKSITGINDDENIWDQRFADLLAFKKKHNHCLVPKVFPQNRTLSYWVFRQRALYYNKRKVIGPSGLTGARIKKLKDVGFIFKAKHSAEQNKVEAARRQPQLDARWNAFYEEFCQYKEETGNCLIPKVFQENQPLSSW